MSTVVGKNCKLYRRSGGSWASPTWTEITNVKDLTLTETFQKADVTRRAGGAVTRSLPTIADVSLEFEQVRDTADTHQTALLAAAIAGTLVDLAVADGNIVTTGTRYYRQEFAITGAPHTQNIADAVRITWTLEPGDSENYGGWTTVS